MKKKLLTGAVLLATAGALVAAAVAFADNKPTVAN
jgi:hypothetical protein